MTVKLELKTKFLKIFRPNCPKRYSDTFFPYSINETIIAAKVGEPSPIRKKGTLKKAGNIPYEAKTQGVKPKAPIRNIKPKNITANLFSEPATSILNFTFNSFTKRDRHL